MHEEGEPGSLPGLFITLEGPDGSGKSSLQPRLVAAMRRAGCDVVATREPGSTPLGEQVSGKVAAIIGTIGCWSSGA